MNGFSREFFYDSSVFSIMFQLSLIICAISGFLGLNVVKCVVFNFLFLVSSRSFCENLAALS